MKKRKAQSNIISTVLLILIVLVAFIIVYNVILFLIKNFTSQINTNHLTTRLEIKDVDLWVSGGARITVKRSSWVGKLDSLRIVLYDQNSGSHVIAVDDEARIPKILETKRIVFAMDEIPVNNSQIDRISVYPVVDNNIGLEFKGKTKPKHLVQVLVEDIVLIKKCVGKVFDGL